MRTQRMIMATTMGCAMVAVGAFVAAALLFGWWGVSAYLSVAAVWLFVAIADSRAEAPPESRLRRDTYV